MTRHTVAYRARRKRARDRRKLRTALREAHNALIAKSTLALINKTIAAWKAKGSPHIP